MINSNKRFPNPTRPPKFDADISLGAELEKPQRMQQTLAVSQETLAKQPAPSDSPSALLREWIQWCRDTGKWAHAADLLERSRRALEK